VYECGAAVLGVNVGQLGYLAEGEPDGLDHALERLLAGRYTVEERMMLAVDVESAGSAAGRWWALNEVVLDKGEDVRLVRLKVDINGEFFTSYAADGLIIATPTGSTAYNLSAGGPILAPTLRAMVVTPVAPHFSLDRSLVLTDEQEVCVKIAPDRAGALVIDGQDVGRLQPGATVTCVVAERAVRVVRNEPQTFGGILRFRLLADRSR